MKRPRLRASTIAGALSSTIILSAPPAHAQAPVIDLTSIAVERILQALQTAANNTLSTIANQIGATTYGDTNTLLREGFTQNANYFKGLGNANMNIADGQNTAMARFHRDMRNAQISDEHTTNPVHCSALDNGQTITVGGGQSWKVAAALQNVGNPRGEGEKNQPAYAGSGQAVQAIRQLHLSRYCSQNEADAGLCSLSQTPNADQRATSLFGTDTYDGQQGVNAAHDYVISLTQAKVPAALRADQLTSISGVEAAVDRTAYNARMSLARGVLDYVLSTQTPSVQLTTEQQQQMTNAGLKPLQIGSWLQALVLDVNRRYSDVNWAAQLQSMPPAAVCREIALELAASNYIALQNYRIALYNASTNATHLAATVEHNFQPATPMPSPNMASQ